MQKPQLMAKIRYNTKTLRGELFREQGFCLDSMAQDDMEQSWLVSNIGFANSLA
jgi:hypothetical protein